MFDENHYNPLAHRGKAEKSPVLEAEKSPVLRELELEMSFSNKEDKNKVIEKTTNRFESWEKSADRLRVKLAENEKKVTGKGGLGDDIYLKIVKAIENKILREEAVVSMLRENLRDLTATEGENLVKIENEILNMPTEDRASAKEALAREILGRKFRDLDIGDEYSRLNHGRILHDSDRDVQHAFGVEKDKELKNELAASEKERARLNALIEKYKNS